MNRSDPGLKNSKTSSISVMNITIIFPPAGGSNSSVIRGSSLYSIRMTALWRSIPWSIRMIFDLL